MTSLDCICFGLYKGEGMIFLVIIGRFCHSVSSLYWSFTGSPGLLTMPHYKQCFSQDTVSYSAIVAVDRKTGVITLPTSQI